MVQIETVYTALATNRHPYAADSSPESIIAVGSGQLIGLWDPIDEADRGVHKTLSGHDSLVTCVRFLSSNQLASADEHGTLIIWQRPPNSQQWNVASKIQAHNNSIACLTNLGSCLVTGSSDSSLKVWNNDEVQLQLVQTIKLSGRYPISLCLSLLPGAEATILAIAGTDKNVQLWIRSEKEFVKSAVLSGHEDWVRSLAFRPPQGDDKSVLLVSGSQDGTIRLWRIQEYVMKATIPSGNGDVLSDDLLDAFEASLGELGDGDEGGRQISLKRHILTLKDDSKYAATFDALLIGHEAGITHLSWQQPLPDCPPTLLSTSTDSSVILWSPSSSLTKTDEESSIWINRQRFGDIGGQRLGGFVGGLWARDGSEVLAWGWSGGWRRWRSLTSDHWQEVGAISGHVGPVKSVSWCPDGDYFISAGSDQTTRIHGPTQDDNGLISWHELGRPQVHGYDLVAAQFLDKLRFISVADEKVARVFEAPRTFVNIVESLKTSSFSMEEHNRPEAANVPPLGLSNKAVSENLVGLSNESHTRRPFEGELAARFLWPEIEKIFGHGYESIALAVSNSGRFVATACKSTSPEHAGIRIYRTSDWQLHGEPLMGHSLTVTRIAFSPDDQDILTVSRDRTWRIFHLDESSGHYQPAQHDKSHARIIWDCAWAPQGDSFATASRDKTVKIWKKDADQSRWISSSTIKLKEAATAIDYLPDKQLTSMLAIGLETGEIQLYVSEDSINWNLFHHITSADAHVAQINRLSWRPVRHSNVKCLASCSEGGAIKVMTVT